MSHHAGIILLTPNHSIGSETRQAVFVFVRCASTQDPGPEMYRYTLVSP